MATAGCIVVESPDVPATVAADLTRLASTTTPDIPGTVSSELTRLAPTTTLLPTSTAAALPIPSNRPQPIATTTRQPSPTPKFGLVPVATLGLRPTATTPKPEASTQLAPTLPRVPVANNDYDMDDDGLVEISNLDQLNAIRFDLNGSGSASSATYVMAFPRAKRGMGCPASGCTGYELTANLDLITYRSDGLGWAPIGGQNGQWSAVFDGNGHTISNLYIDRRDTDGVGLFGIASSNSVIRRLRLESFNASGEDYVGAMVGKNDGLIADSYTIGSASGAGSVGGLVGENIGSITASYATGSVSGAGSVGGLVGENIGSITASYATGSVSGAGSVGGLVGENSGTIMVSYTTGSVSGAGSVGGLVGENIGSITASYATGSVSGAGSVGGLAGENISTITESFSVGHVLGQGQPIDLGGLVGKSVGGRAINSYWDTHTSGQVLSFGGTGKTTIQLQSPTSSSDIYTNWTSGWWDFGTSGQYPVLKYGDLSVTAQR